MNPSTTEALELFSLKEAAKLLSICKRTLEREIAAGRFPRPLKIGRASRVSRGQIANYLRLLHVERGPNPAEARGEPTP